MQAIREGFRNKESTLACFIDLEKANDSVWREGLMVKCLDKVLTVACGLGYFPFCHAEM